jgi:hypothetical protein
MLLHPAILSADQVPLHPLFSHHRPILLGQLQLERVCQLQPTMSRPKQLRPLRLLTDQPPNSWSSSIPSARHSSLKMDGVDLTLNRIQPGTLEVEAVPEVPRPPHRAEVALLPQLPAAPLRQRRLKSLTCGVPQVEVTVTMAPICGSPL